ncbi:MAG: signal recognition particle protein [Armatimonadota bacterium]
MFESLTDKLQGIFKRMSGAGKLRPKDVRAGLKEVRMALLEADVNYQVVKDFINDVQEEALGEEILSGLNPTAQIVDIVHQHLVELLGEEAVGLELKGEGPSVVLLAGLNGSGKTTTAGKLALHLKKNGRNPLLCAGDVYRPAAIDQLQQVGEQVDVPVFTEPGDDPVKIAQDAVELARKQGHDVVIVDTAGRLQIDEDMMDEIEALEKALDDPETILVVDALTGQEAVNIAEEFGDRLDLDGIILTKLDGDARGGAALSARAVTGTPIKFVGVGEKLEALERFHPDRMAQRILGMGDVLTLVEKAREAVDEEKARQMQEKLMSAEFDMEDFREQLRNVRNMGPLDQVFSMIPGAQKLGGALPTDFDEAELDRVEAIINSMTVEEKKNPKILNGSRRRRIAEGSGTSVQDVNILIKQYDQLSKMMKTLSKGGPMNIGGLRLG